jgi:hypothetical protein
MKVKNIVLLFSSLVFSFFCACVSNETANSDTVKQTEIYQNYNITYDAGDMELSASASFRFGGSAGTTLNLVKPSQVTFDGAEMAMGKNILSGTFYESNQQTDPSKSYTFIFTDTENKTYTNTASIEPLEISEYPSSINKSEGFKVSWTGSPIQNGEKVYLSLEGADMSNCSASTEMIDANSIDITPEMLKDMKPGNANITLKREISNSLKNATHLGGNIDITYISKKVSVKVE